MIEITGKYAKIIVDELKLQHEKAGQKATGNALANFVSSHTDTEITVEGVDYVEYLDRGRGAGKVPKGFIGIIYKWSFDKGLSFFSDRERLNFAFFTSKKIAEKGTYHHRNKKTFAGVENPISRVFSETSILEDLMNEVVELQKGAIMKVTKANLKRVQ